MKFLGIDLGKKLSGICLININLKIEIITKIRTSSIVKIVKEYNPHELIIAIDSPLSFPVSGYFRDCDLELIKLGIPCISPIILKDIVIKAIEMREKLKEYKIIEVYPYATRKILNICPNLDKRKERLRLIKCIERKLKISLPHNIGHDEIDAFLASYTAYLYYNNKCKPVGKESKIYIPKIS